MIIGTLTYTLGGDWSVVDGFYFAVATLTTSNRSEADPAKIFTALYVLVGIGILVEGAAPRRRSIRVRQQTGSEGRKKAS